MAHALTIRARETAEREQRTKKSVKIVCFTGLGSRPTMWYTMRLVKTQPRTNPV